MPYLWVGLGSALGGMMRYWCSLFLARTVSETFPWGTMFVNVTGSAFIGFFATLTAVNGRFVAPISTRQFVMTGICGGFTTFSAFSLETLILARDGEWMKAAESFKAALKSEEDFAEASYNLALMGAFLNNGNFALDVIARALKQNPSHEGLARLRKGVSALFMGV